MTDQFQRAAFSAALENARRERVPVMALRPDHRFPEEMDDIVIKDCDVHLEAMDDDVWWMACTFKNGEEVVLHFTIDKKPKRIVVSVTSKPREWRDWDDIYREHCS